MSDEIKKGLLGIVVDETEVSKVMPEINSLTYRGYAAQDLCAKCKFEEVAYLILNGELPNKKQLNEKDLKEFFLKIKNKEINGANITTPFKKDVISYVDQLSLEAEKTRSVNTVYLKDNKIIGHNNDIDGFEIAIK